MFSIKNITIVSIASVILGVGYLYAPRGEGPAVGSSEYDAAHQSNHTSTLQINDTNSKSTLDKVSSSSSSPSEIGKKVLKIVVSEESIRKRPVLRLIENQMVAFSITSDVDGTLAIHGITGDIPIRKGEEKEVDFLPTVTGRFTIHVHEKSGGHLEVATLEVLPN